VDDDLDDLRHFFATAGYLHIKNVFSDEEVTLYSNAIEEARLQTHPADGFSWWSVNRDGQEMVTRINHLERFSSIFDELACDPRLARFACLVDKDLLPCRDRLDGPMVFIKNPGVVKRNGDLRWHTDDGSGGHSVMCPLVQAGVQLEHANAENGQILVLAASHRYTKHWIHWGGEGDFPVVPINTEPGDLTLHYGDTMHTTPLRLAQRLGDGRFTSSLRNRRLSTGFHRDVTTTTFSSVQTRTVDLLHAQELGTRNQSTEGYAATRASIALA